MANRNQGSRTSNNGTGGTGAFIVGALIGSVLSSLYVMFNAPRSGKETRESIQTQGQDLTKQITGETVEDATAEAKAEVRGFSGR
jgi:gas vesicle protein